MGATIKRIGRFKYVGGGIFFVLVIGAALFYLIRLLFAESLYFSQPSVPYYLLLDDQIKAIPTPGHVDRLKYFYSAGDGPKPPGQGLTFVSDGSRDELSSSLATHFRNIGYERVGDNEFRDGKYQLVMSFFEVDGDSVRVRIMRFLVAERDLDWNWG